MIFCWRKCGTSFKENCSHNVRDKRRTNERKNLTKYKLFRSRHIKFRFTRYFYFSQFIYCSEAVLRAKKVQNVCKELINHGRKVNERGKFFFYSLSEGKLKIHPRVIKSTYPLWIVCVSVCLGWWGINYWLLSFRHTWETRHDEVTINFSFHPA